MRLATWNCRQRVDAKRAAFGLLSADIVVVPECSAEPGFSREPGVSFLWRGEYERKGLGVVGFNGWTVEPLAAGVVLPWVVPARVRDPSGTHAFDLLAVWTVLRKDGRPGYAGQVARVIDAWEAELALGRTVMAGDFNCSLRGPSGKQHRANFERLDQLGVRSCYHALGGFEHGAEAAMTLQWVAPGRIRRGYHCDFIFLPAALMAEASSVSVGTMSDWVDSGLSDHCPVTVQLA